jgi:hypothetical protein
MLRIAHRWIHHAADRSVLVVDHNLYGIDTILWGHALLLACGFSSLDHVGWAVAHGFGIRWDIDNDLGGVNERGDEPGSGRTVSTLRCLVRVWVCLEEKAYRQCRCNKQYVYQNQEWSSSLQCPTSSAMSVKSLE